MIWGRVVAPRYRYPFPPNPDGWYLLTDSASLGVGAVLPMRYFGRDLVLYRTEGGQAVLIDAHCPHMGAHLGYGGAVAGEGIQCPFHHWCFDASGKCVEVPYATVPGRPPKVSLNTWEVREHSGLIMAWCSDTGQRPTWEPPERPEFGMPGFVGYEKAGWTIRMHTQELCENIPDMAHFTYVHEVGPQLRADIEIKDHVYRQRSLVVTDGVPIEFTTQEASGLGLVWLHTQSGMWFLTATTPIDDEYVELRLLFLVPDPSGTGVVSDHAQQMIDATVENTGRDVPIWENKVYVEHAPLVPEDGPINALRKWARQFYPEGASSSG